MDANDTASLLLEYLGREHERVVKEAELLDEAVGDLHFEGKASRGKNYREIEEIMAFFNGPFLEHLKVEEDVIYPFFEKHVPKFESLILLLRSEHQDMRHKLKQMNDLLQGFGNQKRSDDYRRFFEKIETLKTYFLYLLQHHLHIENEQVFKTVVEFLSDDEVETLSRLVENHSSYEASCVD